MAISCRCNCGTLWQRANVHKWAWWSHAGHWSAFFKIWRCSRHPWSSHQVMIDQEALSSVHCMNSTKSMFNLRVPESTALVDKPYLVRLFVDFLHLRNKTQTLVLSCSTNRRTKVWNEELGKPLEKLADVHVITTLLFSLDFFLVQSALVGFYGLGPFTHDSQ